LKISLRNSSPEIHIYRLNDKVERYTYVPTSKDYPIFGPEESYIGVSYIGAEG
jgi:hypothetical protein